MRPLYGSQVQMAIRSDQDTDWHRLDFKTNGLQAAKEFANLSGLEGNLGSMRQRMVRRRVGGTVLFEPTPADLQLLLPWLLGSSEAGGVFAPGEVFRPRTVVVRRAGQFYYHTGVLADAVEFYTSNHEPKSNQYKLFQLSADLVGLDQSRDVEVTLGDIAPGVPFVMNSLTLDVGGTTVYPFDFNLTVKYNVLRDRFLNALTLADVLPTKREVFCRFTLPFGQYQNLYNTIAYNGFWDTGAVTAEVTGATHTATIYVPKITLPGLSPPDDRHRESVLTMHGQAFKVDADTPEFTVTLESNN